MRYPHPYLAGIELFNNRRFWHAHEEWEEAWLAADDPQIRLFYQGIIQTAAALVHWQKNNPKGLHLNWHKARAKLTGLPSEVMGLDLQQLISDMDRFEQAEGKGLEPPRLVIRGRQSRYDSCESSPYRC
jgi:predicted metal-dependent hydrolase